MGKVDELLNAVKLNNVFHKKEEQKKCNIGKVCAIVGIVVGVLGIAYLVYRFVSSRCPNDFDDEYDDDFDDDFFEEEME